MLNTKPGQVANNANKLKKADNATDATQMLNKLEDAAKATDKIEDATKTAEKLADTNKNLSTTGRAVSKTGEYPLSPIKDVNGNVVGGIYGTISKDGYLDYVIDIYEATAKGKGLGAKAFDDMISGLGSTDMKGIRGTWVSGDNLTSFKKALSEGVKAEDAAFSTFTGKMAKKHGFDRVRVVTSEGKVVVVEFFK